MNRVLRGIIVGPEGEKHGEEENGVVRKKFYNLTPFSPIS
jgi:hypothetical protein